MPAYGSNGGDFSFGVAQHGGDVPGVRPQKVYLQFGGGNDVRVNGRSGISFDALDARTLNSHYAGETDELISAIIENMRTDYLSFNVDIFSSTDGPPPDGEYSTLYFGGYDPGLLGLGRNG